MPASAVNLQSILRKAEEGKGLLPEEAEGLLREAQKKDWESIFLLAKSLTEKNFRKKITFFAPLYFSNYCANDCSYCGFRRTNTKMKRRELSPEEFAVEAEYLWKQGHRTLLLVSGEHPVYPSPEKVEKYLQVLERKQMPFSVAIEVESLDVYAYQKLKASGVNCCVLFQETYDREFYAKFHSGPKQDYDWRLASLERAHEGGIDYAGLGILLGLCDWRKDFPAMLQHACRLKEKTGNAPTTVSLPRLRPALGITELSKNQHLVSDREFEKIVALTRIALPQTGIVLSTRESKVFRGRLLRLGIGITHLSAGACTSPGGYAVWPDEGQERGQFYLSDSRPLEEVAAFAEKAGYQPCTRPFYEQEEKKAD